MIHLFYRGIDSSHIFAPIKNWLFSKINLNSSEIDISKLFFKEIFKNIKDDSFHTFFHFWRHFYSFCSLAPWHAYQTPFDWPIWFHGFKDQSPYCMVNRPWKHNSPKLVRGKNRSVCTFLWYLFTHICSNRNQFNLNVLELFTTIHDQSINIKGWYLITVA